MDRPRPRAADRQRSPEKITVMRHLLLLGLAWLASCVCASAEVLTNGLSMTVASNAMQKAGYKKTGLEMVPHPGEVLEFWQIGDGVLIASYSETPQKIVGLAFWFADERPKATRRTFELDVASFDTDTGVMTIRTIRKK